MAHISIQSYPVYRDFTQDAALYAALAGLAHVIRNYQRKVLVAVGLVLAASMVGYVLVRLLARGCGFNRE